MARARRRLQEEPEEHSNDERWLLTYADMITLLMVLFIVLFAISQIDQKKFDKLHDGLSNSFGASQVLDGGAGVLQGSEKQAKNPDGSTTTTQVPQVQAPSAIAVMQEDHAIGKVQADITARLGSQGLKGAVEFHRETRGLVINIVTDSVLFEVGSATLRPDGMRVLDAITPPLASMPNKLVIEGHTDNVAISGGRYPSNWELSAERATSVLRFLLTDHVRADAVSAAAYADQRPLVANDTAAHRTRNRRVAIVVLSATPPLATTPSGA